MAGWGDQRSALSDKPGQPRFRTSNVRCHQHQQILVNLAQIQKPGYVPKERPVVLNTGKSLLPIPVFNLFPVTGDAGVMVSDLLYHHSSQAGKGHSAPFSHRQPEI